MAQSNMYQPTEQDKSAALSSGAMTKWARTLRQTCRTPGRMHSLARTLVAMREQSERAPGLQLTSAELRQAHSRGGALEIEARAWSREIRRAA